MASNTLIQFGLSIRRWRKDLGYNQEELGKMAGVSKQYISNIERAEPSSYTGEPTQPSIEVVDSLAKALKRPIQEMRDLAGYGIEGATGQDADRKAEANRTAEMIQNWMELSPDRQAQAIELIKVLKSQHPEALEIAGPKFRVITDEEYLAERGDQEDIRIEKPKSK